MKYWCVIGLFLILVGCTKHERTYLYIPQLNKDVALFQKNSYWVYLNEKTLQVDCTYVRTDPEVYFESGELTSHEIINVPFDGNLFINNYLLGYEVFLHSIIQPDFGISIFEYSSERIDSLSVNNYIFHDVYHTKCSALPIQSDSIIFDTYVVPHVGIIKLSKKINGIDSTFTLLRWVIKQ